ncbi:MAG: hypothetical protein ACR2LL_08720 [Nitrosopumilus sp.]
MINPFLKASFDMPINLQNNCHYGLSITGQIGFCISEGIRVYPYSFDETDLTKWESENL